MVTKFANDIRQLNDVNWFRDSGFAWNPMAFLHVQNEYRWRETQMLMMASSNGNIFRVTGPLWGNPPMDPLTKATDAELFYIFCALTSTWPNNRDASDLRRHRAHFDVTVMFRRCALMYSLVKLYYSPKNIHTVLICYDYIINSHMFCVIRLSIFFRVASSALPAPNHHKPQSNTYLFVCLVTWIVTQMSVLIFPGDSQLGWLFILEHIMLSIWEHP